MDTIAIVWIIAGVIVATLLIGWIPGAVARSRGHENATAIDVAGFIGVFTFGIIWLVALIWAFTGPDNGRRVARSSGRRVVARRGRSRGGDAVDALENMR